MSKNVERPDMPLTLSSPIRRARRIRDAQARAVVNAGLLTLITIAIAAVLVAFGQQGS